MTARALASSLLLGVAALACNRTPPEPAPVASVDPTPRAITPSAAPSAQTTTTSTRCITPLASAARPIPPPAGAACPPDPEGMPKMPLAEVSFIDVGGRPDAGARDGSAPLKIQVELAKNPHDIERGLMYRTSMGDDRGMLFKLDGRREQTFWMHNTCISLDMMFVDDDGTIVGIVEGAAPLTDTTRSVGCPSSFVLEVNGGWSRKHGVAPGQKIALPAAVR